MEDPNSQALHMLFGGYSVYVATRAQLFQPCGGDTVRNFWSMSYIIMVLFAMPSKMPAQRANVSIKELDAIISAQRSAVRSMQGSYVAHTSADSLASASGLTEDIVEKCKIDFAWSSDKRYIKADLTAQDSHELSENVFDGNDFRRRELKTFWIQKEKSSASEGNQFMNGLLWPIVESEIKAANEDPDETMAIPYCFRAPGWKIRGSVVTIGRVPCIVVEKQKLGRRYFFAPSRGYCLVRADFVWPKNEVKQEVFIYKNVYEHKDVKEVKPGFYLPMEITVISEMCNKHGKATGKLTNRLVARNIRINNVSDSVFVLKPRSGDRVIDNIRGLNYDYVPPDDNTLDMSATIAAQQSQFPSHRKALYYVMIFLVGISIGLLFVFGLRPWFRKNGTAA